MENTITNQEQLLQAIPGGIAKLAMDASLTIVYASETFYSLIKSATVPVSAKTPITLLSILYSADIIYVTQQLATQRGRKDHLINFNFRTLQEDGSFKWVMISGKLTEEVYQVDSEPVPVYACIAVDITEYMIKYKKLEQTNDYMRAITEMSKDLFFEYEIANDKLIFTEIFREIFGKDYEISKFRNRLEKSKMVHPDDRPKVIALFNSMMNGKKQVKFELRMIPMDGKLRWYECYASIIFDENKNPYKVVGKISPTCSMNQEDETTPKLQIDTLTKVYTKASAERLIKEAIIKESPDALSALFLIEVKNYKTINEIIRYVQGEDVLTRIGELLKVHYRSSDIIGRIGLNQFVVYLKDIHSYKNAYDKAERICKEVEEQFSYEHTKSSLTLSIGVAFHKGGQPDYPILLSNAKEAMEAATKTPGCSFEVYQGMS